MGSPRIRMELSWLWITAALTALAPHLLAAPATRASTAAPRLPAFFVPNTGQTAPEVRFEAAAGGSTLFFTSRGVIAVGPRGADPAAAPSSAARLDVMRRETAKAATIRGIDFDGSRPEATVSGLSPIAARIHYFRGSDPARWRTRIPAYAGLLYEGLYPGIDLRFESRDGRLLGTFVVARGADPSQIRWRLRGARPRVDSEGSLRLNAGTRPALLASLPEARQESPSPGKTRVPARYAVDPDGIVSLRFPDGYDISRELLVDSRIFDSTFLGGSGDDIAYAVAADASGKAYVTGSTLSTDFPSVGAIDSTCGTDGNCDAASTDAFVAKIDPSLSGTASLVYATYLGGGSGDVGVGITVDSTGIAYVAGIAHADFPTTAGAYQGTFGSAGGIGADAFLSKISADGSSLLYSTYLGGSNGDGAWAVVAEDSGKAWIAGQTYSSDFPATSGVADDSCGTDGSCDGASDAFLAGLDTSKSGGESLVFATYLGGSADDQGFGIARSASGSIAVAGRTTSTDFPTSGPFQPESGGGYDAFVSVFNDGATSRLSSTYLGGGGYDDCYGIAFDGDGTLSVTGTTGSGDFPAMALGFQPLFGGVFDAYVAKIDPAQSGAGSLLYCTFLGGSNDDEGFGLALDGRGNAHLAGFSLSTDFPARTCPLQSGTGGGYDAFLAEVRPSVAGPASLAYATLLGGGGTDAAYGVALDADANVFLAGQTSSTDFPTVNPADDLLSGTTDAFVAALTIRLPAPASMSPRSGPSTGGTAVTIVGANFLAGATLSIGGVEAGNVVVTGATELTASTPVLSPGTLNDLAASNPDSCGGTLPRAWLADFLDVTQAHIFHNAVEKIFRAGITSGCGAGNYCPATSVTRDQMAIFLLRGKHGRFYLPPPATGTLFGDVAADAFAAAWIEQLSAEQITAGCGSGNYCPSAEVNRASMAVMLLRAKHGGHYKPPAATGVFVDVPATDPFAGWIEQLASEGITSGCGSGRYCPNQATTRGEMAAFLSRTFGLP